MKSVMRRIVSTNTVNTTGMLKLVYLSTHQSQKHTRCQRQSSMKGNITITLSQSLLLLVEKPSTHCTTHQQHHLSDSSSHLNKNKLKGNHILSEILNQYSNSSLLKSNLVDTEVTIVQLSNSLNLTLIEDLYSHGKFQINQLHPKNHSTIHLGLHLDTRKDKASIHNTIDNNLSMDNHRLNMGKDKPSLSMDHRVSHLPNTDRARLQLSTDHQRHQLNMDRHRRQLSTDHQRHQLSMDPHLNTASTPRDHSSVNKKELPKNRPNRIHINQIQPTHRLDILMIQNKDSNSSNRTRSQWLKIQELTPEPDKIGGNRKINPRLRRRNPKETLALWARSGSCSISSSMMTHIFPTMTSTLNMAILTTIKDIS